MNTIEFLFLGGSKDGLHSHLPADVTGCTSEDDDYVRVDLGGGSEEDIIHIMVTCGFQKHIHRVLAAGYSSKLRILHTIGSL